MNELLKKRAGLIAKQRALLEKAKGENRDLNEDEVKEFDSLEAEIKAVDATIAREKAVSEREKDLDQPAEPPYRPKGLASGEPSRNNQKQDDGGFESFGELLNSVKNGDPKGRLKHLEAENGFAIPPAFTGKILGHGPQGFKDFSTTDAGILIPPQFSGNILSLEEEPELVMPRATFIPAGDPPDAEFVVPYFDQGAKGANGGVVISWTAEAQENAEVPEPGIKDLTLKPQEASGLATVNNKTLANWRAAGAFLQNLMAQAWRNGRDMKFIRGSGAGTPLGILAAGNKGAIRIARKTAGTVTFEDIAKMMGRLLPEAMSGAMWCASITLLPAIVQMKDDNGRLIYLPGNVTQGIPPTLLGIPIHWTGKCPVAGQEGDLCLCNLRYYLVKAGSGPFIALSEHVKFKTNQTVFRIVSNIDGQPWVKEPLKLQDGNTTVSPIVILK